MEKRPLDRFQRWVARGLERPGFTQVGLAKRLGIAQPRISEMIAGRRRVQINEVAIIAQYLGEDPPSLIPARMSSGWRQPEDDSRREDRDEPRSSPSAG